MDLNQFVGIPWKEHSASHDGCDCWGLLYLVYKEKFGIVLPLFHDRYDTLEDRVAVRKLMQDEKDLQADWREIYPGEETSGDGVLMTLGARPTHVGIVQVPGKLLHIDFGMANSVIESYTAPKLSKRIAGFYRHHGVVV